MAGLWGGGEYMGTRLKSRQSRGTEPHRQVPRHTSERVLPLGEQSWLMRTSALDGGVISWDVRSYFTSFFLSLHFLVLSPFLVTLLLKQPIFHIHFLCHCLVFRPYIPLPCATPVPQQLYSSLLVNRCAFLSYSTYVSNIYSSLLVNSHP